MAALLVLAIVGLYPLAATRLKQIGDRRPAAAGRKSRFIIAEKEYEMSSLIELFAIPSGENEVFSAKFSNASGGSRSQYLALGLGDGTVSIHNTSTGKQSVLVPAAPPAPGAKASMGLPVTALRWRPDSGSSFKVSEATSAKDVLLAAGSDGVIRHIHANSGRVLSTIYENDSQIYACDYRELFFLPFFPSVPPPPLTHSPPLTVSLPHRQRRKNVCGRWKPEDSACV